jgi:hypothetical protein
LGFKIKILTKTGIVTGKLVLLEKFCISSSDPGQYVYQKYTRRSQRRTPTHQNRRLQKRNDFSHLEMKNIIVDKSMTEKLREIDRLAKESMVFKNKIQVTRLNFR